MVHVTPERRRSQRGMTLVELIVAFTILALLTSMAVPLAREGKLRFGRIDPLDRGGRAALC